MSPSEPEHRQRQFPTRIYAILIDARRERERLELEVVSGGQIAKPLNGLPNWPAIEIEIALFLLAEARRVQQ